MTNPNTEKTMSEHSTEELKRQYEAAKGRLADAKGKHEEARKRWEEAAKADFMADLAAKGIEVGKTRVRVFSTWGGGVIGEFLVIGCEFKRYSNELIPTFAKIKKDGTPSAAGTGIWSFDRYERADA